MPTHTVTVLIDQGADPLDCIVTDVERDVLVLDSLHAWKLGYHAWPVWVKVLRQLASSNQRGKCICGLPLHGQSELHHGILSKRDVQGMEHDKASGYIQHSYNVVLVHPWCHEDLQRAACIEFAFELFGELKVREWYDSLEFRGRQRTLDGLLAREVS